MKNFRILGLALMASTMGLLTSCGPDDDALPPILSVSETTVGISNGTINAEVGQMLRFSWDARQGDARLDRLSINLDGVNVADSTENGRQLPVNLSGGDASNYQDAYNMPVGSNTGSREITFRVTDRDGLSETVSVTINVTAAGTPLATEVTGAFFHIQGSLEGAYNLVDDSQMAASDPDADKDMENTDNAGDPFTGSWEAGTGNSTTFVQDNGFDYDNATEEAAMNAFNSGTSQASVSNPADGDIYIARLRGGSDYAVIKVINVDPTDNTCNCGNLGRIEFDYKKK